MVEKQGWKWKNWGKNTNFDKIIKEIAFLNFAIQVEKGLSLEKAFFHVEKCQEAFFPFDFQMNYSEIKYPCCKEINHWYWEKAVKIKK